MRFSGTLQTQDDPEGWLKTSLNLVGGRVEIVAGGETLGSWSVAQVRAERVEGDRFDLSLGDDRAVFIADDALAFSYEALPKLAKNPIAEVAQGFRQKLMSSARKAAKPSSPLPTPEPEVVHVPSVADSIAWQDPPREAPANVKRLRELIEAARANRAEEEEAPTESEEEEEEKVAEVAVVAIDPPMRLVDPGADPEPLWAGSELGRRIRQPLADDADFFTTQPVEPTLFPTASGQQHELVEELEQLMKSVSSGNLTDAQVEAAVSLVRSLRALLDS